MALIQSIEGDSLVKVDVPGYIVWLVESYISERLLWHGFKNGPIEYIITAGVLQGSMLGLQVNIFL